MKNEETKQSNRENNIKTHKNENPQNTTKINGRSKKRPEKARLLNRPTFHNSIYVNLFRNYIPLERHFERMFCFRNIRFVFLSYTYMFQTHNCKVKLSKTCII